MVHLTTAALGAEEFYTRSNNAARRETVQQAIQADEATQKVIPSLLHEVVKYLAGRPEIILELSDRSFPKYGFDLFQAWLGHPYFEVVSNVGINCFDDKIRRLIQVKGWTLLAHHVAEASKQ